MLRITTLEQSPDQEVYAVRNLGALALAPVLLATVALIIWSLGSGDLTGEVLVAVAALVLLSAVQVAVMALSLRAVEVTVRPDRVLVRQSLLTASFSAISYTNATPIEGGESVLLDPVRTGSSTYSVLTSSRRAFAKRVPSRRMARKLARLLDASLTRLDGFDS